MSVCGYTVGVEIGSRGKRAGGQAGYRPSEVLCFLLWGRQTP